MATTDAPPLQAALDSFKGLAVTVGPAWIDSANWKTLAVGHIGDDVRIEDGFVAASLVIKDRKTIDRALSQELSTVSIAYSCDEAAKNGTYEGDEYDLVALNIKGNSGALLEASFSRSEAIATIQAAYPGTDPGRETTMSDIELKAWLALIERGEHLR